MKQLQYHNIPPVYDSRSRLLILGSFPSVRSREEGFFYAHPQNRFWRVLAAVLGEDPPQTVEQKKRLLLAHGIALWDAAASCEITGSSDASIRGARPNDLPLLLQAADIRQIFTNGGTADRLYRTLLEPVAGRPAVRLPSTSAANASWTEARLVAAWRSAIEPFAVSASTAAQRPYTRNRHEFRPDPI